MPAVRMPARGSAKFYDGGISVYPQDELYREITFIAYYMHWGSDEILTLPHEDRRRFCEEISALHSQGEEPSNNPFIV